MLVWGSVWGHSIPGTGHGVPEGVLGLDWSFRGPRGATAPSRWGSRDLPGRGLEWGEGPAALPLEPVPEECAPGLIPQPQAPVARSSRPPGTKAIPGHDLPPHRTCDGGS